MTVSTRRKVLKGLGVAAPVVWVTPVVTSVVLPAHAQTTTPEEEPEPAPQMFAIGDTGPGGGIVFYLEPGSDGTMGLEAATADQSTAAQWGCFSPVDVTGATGTAIGTGALNTQAILDENCTDTPDAAMAAANVGPGWFLPSVDELNEMYTELHLNGLGGFADGFYWSSSQSSADARYRDFFSGGQFVHGKIFALRVRAVRTF